MKISLSLTLSISWFYNKATPGGFFLQLQVQTSRLQRSVNKYRQNWDQPWLGNFASKQKLLKKNLVKSRWQKIRRCMDIETKEFIILLLSTALHFFMKFVVSNVTMKLGARHCRKPLVRRSGEFEISTGIIIYIFVTFTHSNIDFHKLSETLHLSLSGGQNISSSVGGTKSRAFLYKSG